MMPPVAVARKLSDNEHQIMERGAPDILPLIPTAAKTDSRPHVTAGLDPAIGHPRQIANDAIPVSNIARK